MIVWGACVPALNIAPATLQFNRHGNLSQLLHELEGDGIASPLLVEQLLGLERPSAEIIQQGAYITDTDARQIEWSMNLPHGWLDRDPKDPEI